MPKKEYMRPDTEVPRLRKCPKYLTVGRDLSEHVDIFLRVLSYCSTCNKYLAINEIGQGTYKPVSRKDTSVKRGDLELQWSIHSLQLFLCGFV
jgi:hypothetical protein